MNALSINRVSVSVSLIIAACMVMAGCTTLDEIKGWVDDKTNAPVVVPPVVVPDAPAPKPETPSALTPKPATLCQPDKGAECPTPWGLDVRFLAWAGDDWAFVGCDEAIRATQRDGKRITGNDWSKGGVRYVYAGYKVPRSAGPLVTERTGTYAETYRLYYWPTREGAQ